MLCYVMFLGVISYNVHGECGKREPLADKSIALTLIHLGDKFSGYLEWGQNGPLNIQIL